MTDHFDVIEKWLEVVHEQHNERVRAIFDRLSDREKAIVREAAVMGFVQGLMHAGALHSSSMPCDRDILHRTLDGIGGFPETYPALSGYVASDDREVPS